MCIMYMYSGVVVWRVVCSPAMFGPVLEVLPVKASAHWKYIHSTKCMDCA